MPDSVIVVDYNPEWPKVFEAMKVVFENHLGEYVLDILHIGSTSVPGLAAKPKIDLDIIVRDADDAQLAIADLATLGYTHTGDLGVKDREAFKRKNDFTPDDGSGRKWMAHNLYVCIEDGDGVKNHLAIRDYLRSHPEKARAYGELKKELAKRFPNDIDGYGISKTDFIIDILKEVGLDDTLIEEIEQANKS